VSILVVGSLHLDVVLDAPHLPALDETVTGKGVNYVFGGKGGNQALAASRMGSDVHFAGRVGRDGFGDILRNRLKASALDILQLQQDEGPSGMSAAIVNTDGDYGAVIVSAANLNIEASAVSIPDGCTLVVLQNEIPEAVNLAVAEKAKSAGAQVWLNAAPARQLNEALIASVDLLIVNRVESAFYQDMTASVEVLTTLGSDGVSYRGDTYDGHKVSVISTHGAGDVFVGALAAEVDKGGSIANGIPFAQGAAALHVSSELPVRDTFNRQDVLSFLDT